MRILKTHRRRYFPLLLYVIICVLAAGCTSNDIDCTPPPDSTETFITHYSFGKMVIDGKTYESDLAILPGGKVCHWSFGPNHEISPENLNSFISGQVKTIIIGNGYVGNGHLTSSAKDMIAVLRSKGLTVHFIPSGKAVILFNASSKKGLLALFHLNC